MLFLVGAWLILLAVTVPVGLAVLRWTGATAFDRAGDRFVLSAWLGLIGLGSGLLAASFLFALSPLVGTAIGGAAATAALASRGVREDLRSLGAALTPRLAAALLAFVAGVAVLTTQPVVWIDTGIYHASAIRWLSEFGAVEGIGLVHHRLGFASSWFALAAPFNPDGLRTHAEAVMGGFALLLLGLHAAICLGRVFGRAARPGDWMIIAASALLLPVSALSSKVHVSPSPDLPVNALTLVAGWTILVLALAPRPDSPPGVRLSPGPDAVPLLLALGAMAIKPHAAPLVAIAALFYVFRGRDWPRRGAWAVVVGAVLLGPWLAYEFVTTGCPAFPAGVCADVPWSVGGGIAGEAAEAVGNARWETFYPGEGLSWVEPWLTDDLSPWLSALGLASAFLAGAGLALGRLAAARSPLSRAAPWVALAGAAGLFAFFVRAEEIFMVSLAAASLLTLGERSPAARWLLVLGVGGIALLVYAAPDPRFAFGYMAVLVGRFAVFPPRALWARVRPYLVPEARLPRVGLASLLAIAALVAALGPTWRPTTSRADVAERFGVLLPPETRSPFIATTEMNGIAYSVPADGFCWTAELPCTPDPIDAEVVLREPEDGIGGGFAR